MKGGLIPSCLCVELGATGDLKHSPFAGISIAFIEVKLNIITCNISIIWC